VGSFHILLGQAPTDFEIMLEAGIGTDEMCCALSQALDLDRLDLIQLLCRFGADPKTIPYEYAVQARDTSIETLGRLLDSGLISQTVFKELMSAPRMREILNSGRPGAPRLREIAGIPPTKRRRK